MKNYSLIIVAALLTVSASTPAQVAVADTVPAVVQYSGTSGSNL